MQTWHPGDRTAALQNRFSSLQERTRMSREQSAAQPQQDRVADFRKKQAKTQTCVCVSAAEVQQVNRFRFLEFSVKDNLSASAHISTLVQKKHRNGSTSHWNPQKVQFCSQILVFVCDPGQRDSTASDSNPPQVSAAVPLDYRAASLPPLWKEGHNLLLHNDNSINLESLRISGLTFQPVKPSNQHVRFFPSTFHNSTGLFEVSALIMETPVKEICSHHYITAYFMTAYALHEPSGAFLHSGVSSWWICISVSPCLRRRWEEKRAGE